MRTLTAFDVDTDALADAFDRMADGIRSGDVAINEVESNHVAVVEDPSKFYLGIEFVADEAFEDVVDPIEYDTGADE